MSLRVSKKKSGVSYENWKDFEIKLKRNMKRQKISF